MEIAKLQQEIDKILIEQEDIDDFEASGDNANICAPSRFVDELIDEFKNPKKATGLKLPWIKTHDKYRFDKGELSIWGGYNGAKKSMTLSQVALSLATQGSRVCIASMEMTPIKLLKRKTLQACGNNHPTEEMIRKFISWCENKIYIFNQQNTVPAERVLKMARYCGSKLKIDNLIVDSLMKCGIAPDDYGKQKQFIDELCAIAKDSNMNIHLVCHMRKPPADKFYIPNRYDISGGSDITNQADNIFICWSDVEKNRERGKPEHMQDQDIMNRPCQIFVIEKQREGEDAIRFTLNFDSRSLQFIEHNRIDYWEHFK